MIERVGCQAWERLPQRLRQVFWTFHLPLLGPHRGRSWLEKLFTEAEAGEAQGIEDWCLLRRSLQEIGHSLPPLPTQRLLQLPPGPVRAALLRSLFDDSFLRQLFRKDWLAYVHDGLVSKVVLPFEGTPEEVQRMVDLAQMGQFRFIFRFLARLWAGGSEQAATLLQKIGADQQLARLQAFRSHRQPDAALCQILEVDFQGSEQAWTFRAHHREYDQFQVDFQARTGSCSYARFDFSHKDGLSHEVHPWDRDDRDPIPQTLEDWIDEHFLAFALHDL